jgi:hypothetical protein
MILGTHTFDNEPKYLMLAQVQLLLEDAKNDSRQYDDEHGEIGEFSCANGKVRLMILSMLLSMVVNDILLWALVL